MQQLLVYMQQLLQQLLVPTNAQLHNEGLGTYDTIYHLCTIPMIPFLQTLVKIS
uniref:Uncharacterized protein n=1 Tax=Meloidogyne enterolobii TaxID=390850 RepID=A0A6V7VN55_MELEN|nr:unnamed protein product [Meloidogyne enterolobii]